MNHLVTIVQDKNKDRRAGLNIKFKGKTKHLTDWADELGLNPETIRRRLKKGQTVKEAMTV